MKKLCLLVFACFIFFSCKNDAKPDAGNSYLTDIVGKMNGGNFEVTNSKAIKAGWEATPVVDSVAEDIAGFEIIHGITEGTQQEYYLLLAKNKSGNVKTAAPLVLKGNDFYFEQPGETTAYLKITCKSACTNGCNPVMKISDGSRFLVCSSCPDCIKVETEMR